MKKTAIITGSGSGIGRETCVNFAENGLAVLGLDIDNQQFREAQSLATHTNDDIELLDIDISKSDEVSLLARHLEKTHKRIDFIINCAATMTFKPVTKLSEDEWDKVINTNLRGTFLMCKYFIPLMAKGGSITNIGSVHASQTTENVAPYAASKGAIESFTRALSLECLDLGIRVNCVTPGSVDTPMLWNNPNIKTGKEKLSGPIAKPSDIANIIFFLCTDKASAINGSCIVVDNALLAKLG